MALKLLQLRRDREELNDDPTVHLLDTMLQKFIALNRFYIDGIETYLCICTARSPLFAVPTAPWTGAHLPFMRNDFEWGKACASLG